MAYLEISNMYKSFKNTKVLNGISLSVNKGEVAVIIGESGNGKTTLLRCLNGLETIDTGNVTIDGRPIDFRKNNNFGMIFQSFNLFPQYSALKNVTLALDYISKANIKEFSFIKRQKMLKLRRKENEAVALNLLDKMNLLDKKDNYPCQLSGGQQQRVAIARALALKPEILCFDEPTSALDPKTTLEVVKVIKDLKEEGNTLLIITHDISFAKEVADTVYFLKQGVIIEKGTAEEILQNPKSKELISFLGA